MSGILSRPPVAPLEPITISFDNDRLFVVEQSGRTADRLCWDEMLGQLVNLTHPRIRAPHYPMLTPEEIAERETRHRDRLAQHQDSSS